jgi:hypothetical protein
MPSPRLPIVSSTLTLKSCPSCRGDMVLELDRYGPYRTCIQCGHTQDHAAPPIPCHPEPACPPLAGS